MFFGSTLLALAVGVIAAIQLRQPDSGYLQAGAVLAVVAAIVTIAFNVPLNNRLDAVDRARPCSGRHRLRMAGLREPVDLVEPRAHRGAVARFSAVC
jgi:hypothetical protein